MGCVASKADLTDLQRHVFRVWNVDDSGRPLNAGQLEVTGSELVWHQRGREPIRWPMRCLRRYGFDAELFSFESGRRCPTGSRIYAFKCRRAEELFNLLQEHIQASGQEDQNHGVAGVLPFNMPRSQSLSDAGYLEPITRARPRGPPISLPNSLSSSSTGLLSPTARTNSPHCINEDGRATTPPGTTALAPLHEYVNSSAIENGELDCPLMELVSVKGGNGCRVPRSDDNYARLEDLLKQEHSAKQRLYVNIKPDEKTPIQDPYYANIKVSPIAPSIASSQGPVRQVNYVVLDLDPTPADAGNSPNSPLSEATSLPESPSRSAEGYATIDFDRTAALSNSANPCPDKDESQRKTRHNSTISELILSRHNSAVSE